MVVRCSASALATYGSRWGMPRTFPVKWLLILAALEHGREYCPRCYAAVQPYHSVGVGLDFGCLLRLLSHMHRRWGLYYMVNIYEPVRHVTKTIDRGVDIGLRRAVRPDPSVGK